MADEILNVRADAYRACILLDALPTMTLEKFRKLMRLMTKYPDDNREALEQLGRFLPERVSCTLKEWELASMAYIDGFQLAPKNPRNTKERAACAKNRELLVDMKRAKAAHTKATKMAEIYQSMI